MPSTLQRGPGRFSLKHKSGKSKTDQPSFLVVALWYKYTNVAPSGLLFKGDDTKL